MHDRPQTGPKKIPQRRLKSRPANQSCAMTETAERIVLASRPVGEPTLDNFRLEELPIPQPGPGQMLLRTRWLSLDPYMRGRMSDAPSYAKPVGIGEVMEGSTVSEVVTSNAHCQGRYRRRPYWLAEPYAVRWL
jgi:hypothetical protein